MNFDDTSSASGDQQLGQLDQDKLSQLMAQIKAAQSSSSPLLSNPDTLNQIPASVADQKQIEDLGQSNALSAAANAARGQQIAQQSPSVADQMAQMSNAAKAATSSAKPPTATSSDEDDQEEPANASPATPTQQPAQPALSSRDTVLSYLKNKYGIGDTSAIKAAQEQARQNMGNALMSRAGATIGSALTRGATKVDEDFYKTLEGQANKPVENLLQQNAVQADQLKQAGAQEALVNEMSKNDPASDINKGFREFLSGIPAFKGKVPATMTVADPAFTKVADVYMQSEARKDAAAQRSQLQELMLGDKQDKEEKKDRQGAVQALERDKEYQKLNNNDADYDKLDAIADLGRTNPRAAAQLPLQIVSAMMSGRMSKVALQAASGGQDLQDVAERMGKRLASGTLTDADYNQLKQWTKALRQTNQSSKASVENRHAKNYSSTSDLDLDEARTNMGLQPLSESLPSAQSPDDQQAVTWAQANPNDPRAAKILALHGVQH